MVDPKVITRFFPVLLFLGLVLNGATYADPADLDPTFGQGGYVYTEINPPPEISDFYPQAQSILIQPDGKILVCGMFWEDGVSDFYGTFLARYTQSGALDLSFGQNGTVSRAAWN